MRVRCASEASLVRASDPCSHWLSPTLLGARDRVKENPTVSIARKRVGPYARHPQRVSRTIRGERCAIATRAGTREGPAARYWRECGVCEAGLDTCTYHPPAGNGLHGEAMRTPLADWCCLFRRSLAKVVGLEPTPAVLETAALPVELHQRGSAPRVRT